MNWTDKIQVYNEDCMETMARYDDNFFDLAIVDPPYGIDINSSARLGHYGGKGKTWDSKKPSNFYFIELSRISKNAKDYTSCLRTCMARSQNKQTTYKKRSPKAYQLSNKLEQSPSHRDGNR